MKTAGNLMKMSTTHTNTVSFDEIDKYTGVLNGIKGQYFIFEDGSVFNLRKHNGYLAEIEIH
ncbi:MAG: DUF2797 domain-containing protein [Bacteroidales bacterium]|nr:DUF2797 domain-containing protein [Bacteroidales bacterium]MBS3775497.1 DUF2797 domain-containing protein [Bacteroidales bacterium]